MYKYQEPWESTDKLAFLLFGKGGQKRGVKNILTGSLPSLPRLIPPLFFLSFAFSFFARPQLPRAWSLLADWPEKKYFFGQSAGQNLNTSGKK